MEETKTFKAFIYGFVAEIIEMKQGNTDPCMAHIREIRNSLNVELMEALRSLCKDGTLAAHPDAAKQPMFEIKRPIQ